MDFVLPVVFIGVSLSVPWLGEVGLARIARYRMRRGRMVAVRARLRLDDRKEAAIVRRHGADLAINTARRTWLVPASDIAVARGRTGGAEQDERWTLRLRTAHGSLGVLDVRRPWREVVQSLADAAPTATTSGGRTGPVRPFRCGQ